MYVSMMLFIYYYNNEGFIENFIFFNTSDSVCYITREYYSKVNT